LHLALEGFPIDEFRLRATDCTGLDIVPVRLWCYLKAIFNHPFEVSGAVHYPILHHMSGR
jgi:hypothetical protein